jgi:hypothetical protein
MSLVSSMRKCPLCRVEYIGDVSGHDCERDAWAAPHPQPIGPTVQPAVSFDDLRKYTNA